ncbi:hypothetical protein ACFS07_14015 [Undibacterium arcticum]
MPNRRVYFFVSSFPTWEWSLAWPGSGMEVASWPLFKLLGLD